VGYLPPSQVNGEEQPLKGYHRPNEYARQEELEIGLVFRDGSGGVVRIEEIQLLLPE
jgi:hypothetical protein